MHIARIFAAFRKDCHDSISLGEISLLLEGSCTQCMIHLDGHNPDGGIGSSSSVSDCSSIMNGFTSTLQNGEEKGLRQLLHDALVKTGH